MKIEGLYKIYILHYRPLKERRVYLEKQLKELKINQYAKWIISEKDKITKKELAFYDSSNKALEERMRILGHDFPKVGKIDIIMMLQHLKLFKKIAQRKNKNISMIFEDDVLLSEDFPEKLGLTIKKLGKLNWDICYTDMGSLFVEPNVKKQGEVTLYKPLGNKSNTTGSYLVNPKSARKIVRLLRKFAVSPDNELSYIQKKYKLKVFWAVPFLTRQGSIEHIYKSNVRTGTLTGDLLKIIRKIEKVSPGLAKVFANFSDKLRKSVYKSKFLLWIKDKIKSCRGYNL